MNKPSRAIIDAATRISNSDESFEWVRVPKKYHGNKVYLFHQSLRRLLTALGLPWTLHSTTRKETPYIMAAKVRRVREL